MKTKLYCFFIMFSIWCLINMLATVILRKTFDEFYFSSFHPVNFYVAFIFSFIAVMSTRYFYLAIIGFSVYTACCLVPGLIQGDLVGDNGFIPVENINNVLFVHNEFLLDLNMNIFYQRMPLTVAIVLSDVIIILLSAFLIITIRYLSIQLLERWLEEEEEFTTRA